MKELRQLRIKFVLSNMAIVTALLCLGLFAIGLFNRVSLEREAERFLQGGMEPGTAAELFLEGQETRIPHFTLILNGDREIVGIEGQYRFQMDDALLRRLAAESLSAEGDSGRMEHYRLRYLRLPQEEGYRISYVDTSIGDSYAADMWRTLLMTGCLIWLGFFGVSLLLSRWAVNPVERSMQREKLFLADASHELKTPLTVIVANAELLAQNGEAASHDKQRWTSNILQEAEGMKGLVEEMLELSRSEARASLREKKELCLSDLVIESVLSFEAVFYQEGKELLSDIQEGVSCLGSEEELRRLVCILLDNAEKYTPEGGKARVSLQRTGSRIRLTVSNTGDPIPPEERKKLFQRFYRADPARSGRKGFGLGLAIARTIAEHHRGRLTVDSREGWNSFTLELRG